MTAPSRISTAKHIVMKRKREKYLPNKIEKKLPIPNKESPADHILIWCSFWSNLNKELIKVKQNADKNLNKQFASKRSAIYYDLVPSSEHDTVQVCLIYDFVHWWGRRLSRNVDVVFTWILAPMLFIFLSRKTQVISIGDISCSWIQSS